MATYTLFDEEIFLTDEEERFYDYHYRKEQAKYNARQEFIDWFNKCKTIEAVVNGYPKKSAELVIAYANKPLFEELTELEIYDMSEDSYDRQCFVLSASKKALAVIKERLEEIRAEQEAKKEYRAERKDNRGRVVGGGFGVDGALKGMATAGAMNAVSGLGHGIVNAIGNAGSAIAAEAARQKLYKEDDTFLSLTDAISEDIASCFHAHLRFLNKRFRTYVENTFDIDKARALFQNAKKVPEKCRELLLESFENWPWNRELLVYIFKEFKEERANVWEAAERFHVDLSTLAEEMFAAAYTEEAKNSEELAQRVRRDILDQMEEIGISHSDTVQQIEIDGISRILRDYKGELTQGKEKIFAVLASYDASTENKAKVIHDKKIWELSKAYHVKYTLYEADNILREYYTKEDRESEERSLQIRPKLLQIMDALGVTESRTLDSLEHNCLSKLCGDLQNADEAACNELKKKIAAYEAQDKSKQMFIQKVQERIEVIWAKEDGDIFDNIYRNTNIYDPNDVRKTIEYIKSKGRTDSANEYLDALAACTEENIRIARRATRKGEKYFKYFGIFLIFLGIVALIGGAGFLASMVIIIVGFWPVSRYRKANDMFDKLTVNCKVAHVMLSMTKEEAMAFKHNVSVRDHRTGDGSVS